jgi:hypothetical protein
MENRTQNPAHVTPVYQFAKSLSLEKYSLLPMRQAKQTRGSGAASNEDSMVDSLLLPSRYLASTQPQPPRPPPSQNMTTTCDESHFDDKSPDRTHDRVFQPSWRRKAFWEVVG